MDIFSYAMVVYETITGRRPYVEFENMSQISKAIKIENKRPSLLVSICILIIYTEQKQKCHLGTIVYPIHKLMIDFHYLSGLQCAIPVPIPGVSDGEMLAQGRQGTASSHRRCQQTVHPELPVCGPFLRVYRDQ